jgi:hypothetical protein
MASPSLATCVAVNVRTGMAAIKATACSARVDLPGTRRAIRNPKGRLKDASKTEKMRITITREVREISPAIRYNAAESQ